MGYETSEKFIPAGKYCSCYPDHSKYHNQDKGAHHNFNPFESAAPGNHECKNCHNPTTNGVTYWEQGTQKNPCSCCNGANGNGCRDELGNQYNPDGPVSGTWHPGKHIYHPLSCAYSITCTTHSNPEFQKDSAYNDPQNSGAKNCPAPCGQDHFSGSDVFRSPNDGRTQDCKDCKSGERCLNGRL